MKTTIAKQLVLAAVAGLLLSPSAFAKKKPLNLSAFAGKYTGTVTLVTPSDSLSGTATVTITVPKNGKSATIVYTAVVLLSGGDSMVLPTTITLAKNKSVAVTDLGVGIAGANNAHPGSGSYSQRKRTLALSATNGDITLTGAAVVKDVRKKRNLSLTLVSSDAGGSSIFTTTLTAKAPKPRK